MIHGLERSDFPLKLRLRNSVISAQNWISLSTLKQRWVTKLKVMLLKRGFLGSKSSEEGKRGLPSHTCRRRDIPPCNIIYYSSPKTHALILPSRKIFANKTTRDETRCILFTFYVPWLYCKSRIFLIAAYLFILYDIFGIGFYLHKSLKIQENAFLCVFIAI